MMITHSTRRKPMPEKRGRLAISWQTPTEEGLVGPGMEPE